MRTSSLVAIGIVFSGLAAAPAAQQAALTPPGTTATAGGNTGANATTAQLEGSFYGGYGDPQVVWQPTGGGRSPEVGADVDLLARRSRQSSDFQVAAFSGLRRYAGSDFWSHSASATLWMAPSTRTSVGLTGMFGYTQLLYLVPNSLGGAALPIGGQSQVLDLSIAPRTTQSYGGGAQVAHSVSTRSSLVLAYDARWTDTGSNNIAQTADQYAQFGFENRFRQRASFRVSYSYRDANYQTGALRRTMQQQGFIVEVDRQWAHSATRQTSLRITGGPSAVFGTGPSRYVGMAGLSLDGKFSRNWMVTGTAAREVSFIDGIAHPFLSDVFSGQADGRLSRTLNLTIGATSSAGSSPFNLDRASYKWRGGNARLQWAWSRRLTVYGEYLYRWYTLSNLPLVTGAARSSPATVRVGLTWRAALKK